METSRFVPAGGRDAARRQTTPKARSRGVRAVAAAALAIAAALPTTGCAGGPLPPPPGGGALPQLLLGVGASVGTYFLIRELE